MQYSACRCPVSTVLVKVRASCQRQKWTAVARWCRRPSGQTTRYFFFAAMATSSPLLCSGGLDGEESRRAMVRVLQIASRVEALQLPRLPAHRALWVSWILLHPFLNTVHVEGVVALPPQKRAVVPRELAIRAAGIEGHPADAAGVIIGVPRPRRHRAVP
eukprot:GGOE01020061.1.p1 GENE.GGOE01020061.1~~GGOE01020061.1.p1  ORF type:complete len:160 (-),score=2.03 GGOE01020061.1:34-513(-)